MPTNQATIPKNWQQVKLGDHIKFQGGNAFKAFDYKHEGVPLVRIGNVGKGKFVGNNFVFLPKEFIKKNEQVILNDGDILMGMTGDLGKVCRIYKNNLPALLNQRVGRVLFRDNKVDVGFLFNIFLSHNFQNRLASFFTGAAQKNISSSQVESIEILLPPLPEQQKIAEILESVDEEIDSVNSEIVKSEKLKRGLMEEFFKRRKEKGEKKKLGEIIEIESGQVDPKIFPYKNMILIAPNHIESDSRTILGKFTANQQNAISGKYFAKKGDVIYSKIRPYLKKVAMAQEDCLCSADMYPIRGKKETINKFLFYLLLSKDFTDYAISASSRTGIPKINREELNEYKLLLPSLEGQKQIAEILSAVDDKIQITKQLKNKLVQLKKGLMEDLLSGVTCV